MNVDILCFDCEHSNIQLVNNSNSLAIMHRPDGVCGVSGVPRLKCPYFKPKKSEGWLTESCWRCKRLRTETEYHHHVVTQHHWCQARIEYGNPHGKCPDRAFSKVDDGKMDFGEDEL